MTLATPSYRYFSGPKILTSSGFASWVVCGGRQKPITEWSFINLMTHDDSESCVCQPGVTLDIACAQYFTTSPEIVQLLSIKR